MATSFEGFQRRVAPYNDLIISNFKDVLACCMHWFYCSDNLKIVCKSRLVRFVFKYFHEENVAYETAKFWYCSILFQLSQFKSFAQKSKNEFDKDFWWKCIEDKKIFHVWLNPHHIRSPTGSSEKEFVQMKCRLLKFTWISDLKHNAYLYSWSGINGPPRFSIFHLSRSGWKVILYLGF